MDKHRPVKTRPPVVFLTWAVKTGVRFNIAISLSLRCERVVRKITKTNIVGMLHFNHMNYVSCGTVTCDAQCNKLTLRQTTLRHQRQEHPAGRAVVAGKNVSTSFSLEINFF